MSMNVDVVGRIRPSIRGEGSQTLQTDGHKLASRPGASYFNFQYLHQQDASTLDIFQRSIQPLVDLSVAGFNTCVLLVGESGAGKSFTLAGDSISKTGLVPLAIEHIFAKIGHDERYMYDNRLNHDQQVTMEVFEIYNELIRDLQTTPGLQENYLETDEKPDLGAHVKNLSSVPLANSPEGTALFRQAWARRIDSFTDYGPARSFSAVVVRLKLAVHSAENPLPNRSQLTIVLTPGAEKLADDSSQVRLREGPTLSKSILSLSQLVAALANQQYPDRVINYSDSKLTYLLKDELGGNCKTRVLVCVKPQSDQAVLTPVLRLAQQFTQCCNFPILNDPFAQQLLTQYKAQLLGAQRELGYGGGLLNPLHVTDPREELRRLQTENLQLRDKNERIHLRLDSLQGKFGNLASTKTDLSAQLLMTEEEKLKVSKTMVEMQIENNKIKEECEATKFELTNKILQLENKQVEVELDRDRHMKAARNAKDKLMQLEKDRKELADEYVALKTNYLAVSKAHESEVGKNEELCVELLNVVNSKAALMRQMDSVGLDMADFEAQAEVDRVKGVVNRMTSKKLRPEDLRASQKDKENMERSLFGDQRHHESQMDKLRLQYDDDEKKLQRKLMLLMKEVNECRQEARDRQKTISELNAQLITARSVKDQLQSENNRLQHKLKDIGDEFRSRLVKYVEDIADYVDGGGIPEKRRTQQQMKPYVDNMMKDLKRAHKVREEQLSQAATSFKKRMDQTVRRHEELLVAYRQLRQLVEGRGLDDLDLGPDEHHLQLTEPELKSAQQKEINRLRDSLDHARNELESLRLRLRVEGNGAKDNTTRAHDTENFAMLRRQLREFTLNTQQELEQERAELLTQNSILEEQVKELQEYIDCHLARYKEEVVKLRGRLGMSDGAGFISPPQPNHYKNPRR